MFPQRKISVGRDTWYWSDIPYYEFGFRAVVTVSLVSAELSLGG